jgi:Divergent InlB B-repeat domain
MKLPIRACLGLTFAALLLTRLCAATPVAYDFDTGLPHLTIQAPLLSSNLTYQTSGGFRAGFLAAQGTISVQSSAAFVHVGLPSVPTNTGLVNQFLYAGGVSNILEIRFDRMVSNVSLTFATPDNRAVSETPVSVALAALTNTANYPALLASTNQGAYVGTNSTFPSGQLTVDSPTPFAAVRVYVPAGQSSGSSLFLVDNIQVTPSDDNHTLVAGAPKPSYGGTVAGGGVAAPGSTVNLLATPNPGFVFTSWTENSQTLGTQSPLTTIASGTNRWLTANFARLYTIAASASPLKAGTVQGAGKIPEGTTASLVATANPGYSFASWSEKGSVVSTAAQFNFMVSSNRTLVANFLPGNPLRLAVAPVNSGTTSGDGIFTDGTTVAVVAHPNPDYAFTGWTENGTVVSTDAVFSFKMAGARSLVANFVYSPSYTIFTRATPSGAGQAIGGGTFQPNDLVTVSAIPATGYAFAYWSVLSGFTPTVVSTNPVFTFPATMNQSLQANFVPGPSRTAVIAVNANAAGGILTGAGTFALGSKVTVAAQSLPGWAFDHWNESGNLISESSSYSFTATGNRVLQAIFIPNLRLSIDANGFLRASWPAGASGFVLETSTLLNTNSWATATNSIGVSSGQNEIVIDASANQAFFRLHQP